MSVGKVEMYYILFMTFHVKSSNINKCVKLCLHTKTVIWISNTNIDFRFMIRVVQEDSVENKKKEKKEKTSEENVPLMIFE